MKSRKCHSIESFTLRVNTEPKMTLVFFFQTKEIKSDRKCMPKMNTKRKKNSTIKWNCSESHALTQTHIGETESCT